MKKFFAFILAGILAIGSCATVFAAPPNGAPSKVSVKQDGKAHNVYAFGTSLALVYTDGSIEIFSIGPDGRVNVMMDGVVTENVSAVTIPGGQRTRMALGNGSIIVKNVEAEVGEAIKKQVDDVYAAGETSIELASLIDVLAYKINEDGEIVNAAGMEVSINEPELSVYSIDALAKLFEEMLKEIMAEDIVRAEAEARAAVPAKKPASASKAVPTPVGNSGTNTSGGTNSSASPGASSTSSPSSP